MKLLASLSVYKTSSPDVGGMHARGFSIFRRPLPNCRPRQRRTAAVYGREGKKLAVSPTATISWSITGTSATACTRFTKKFKKSFESVHICWRIFIYQLAQTIRLGGYYEKITSMGICPTKHG